MGNYDAILIPGGGVRAKGELPLWVKRRLDRAIQIHQGEFIITLSAGTVYKPPPLDEEGFPIFESVAGANYLVNHGIDPNKVLIETCSYDTIGNAFFSRVIHVEHRKFTNLMVITSDFHMARTETIFRWVYNLDCLPEHYSLHFEKVSDEGMDTIALMERSVAEEANRVRVLLLRERIRTMSELHGWLFTENDAYSARAPKWPKLKTHRILDTY